MGETQWEQCNGSDMRHGAKAYSGRDVPERLRLIGLQHKHDCFGTLGSDPVVCQTTHTWQRQHTCGSRASCTQRPAQTDRGSTALARQVNKRRAPASRGQSSSTCRHKAGHHKNNGPPSSDESVCRRARSRSHNSLPVRRMAILQSNGGGTKR